MIIEVSPRFQQAYAGLPEAIKKKAKKAILLLEMNPRHPSLNLEKIDHERGIWSGRVDRSYRFTFQWVPGGMRLRQVGAHEQAYRTP
jgi:mRNA-degrading endonuclease RelE of RelBE toxin-antitoxin system